MGVTVILANGDIPSHSEAYKLLNNAEHIVCCDGAVSHLKQLGYTPEIIVGDMDSISETDYIEFKDRIYIDASEEYNDLQKALKLCLSRGWNEITILGGFGKREDHSIANLSIMHSYSVNMNQEITKGTRIRMVTNFGVFTPIFNTTTFETFPGQQVSVFSISKGTKITFQGLKYPVVERIFDYLWEGSLNEAIGDQFTIQFDNGEVIVYQAF